MAGVLPDLPSGAATVEDLARELEAHPVRAVGLVIDDGHALEGTAAETALGRFVDYAPPWLAIVIAARVPPTINLPRLRVSGELLELGQDDLRFRAWEVEELFRDVYHDPIPPADLAVLARRTEGWAAGLQLFHLATQGRPMEERRRMLGRAGVSSRLLREYLAQNVLSGLPDELRQFLLETCVLGRLSGALCDRLLGTSGSQAMLDELARRSVFTVPVEDTEDEYRYHSVLRQQLDRMLVEACGEAEARVRHARAGALLEADGALPEALRAYCRAEDWDAASRLLGRQGEHLAATGRSGWMDAVPPAFERHDPWVALAVARRARNDGRWSAAIEGYLRAESALGPSRAADAPRRERQAINAWLDPAANPTPDAAGVLRAGLVRDPGVVAREAVPPDDLALPVARGLLALAGGEVTAAHRQLRAVTDTGGVGPFAMAAARLGAQVAGLLSGRPWDPGEVDRAVEQAERAGVPWLARLARAIGVALGDEPASAASEVPSTVDEGTATELVRRADATSTGSPGRSAQDPWIPALALLARGWSRSRDAEDRLRSADAAATAFRRLGAGVLEAWARGLAALAATDLGAADARDVALVAESAGRAAGTQAPRLLAYAALARLDDPRATDFALMAEAVGRDTGLVLPADDEGAGTDVGVPAGHGHGVARDSVPGDLAPGDSPAADRGASVHITTLGGFTLDVDGHRVPLDGAKPRVRSLLRLLAVHAGSPVHREVLQEALWPDADATAGARNLHVALSTLRRWLDEVAAPPGGLLVERDGDAYRLAVSSDEVDVGRFDEALAAARAAEAHGDQPIAALSTAIELYGGDLLPEEGPSEWAVARRDHYREAAVEAARALAEASLIAGDTATAVRACRFGLELDRYQDALWRNLIEARESAGDAGAASRDRREYAAVLEGLGVSEGLPVNVS